MSVSEIREKKRTNNLRNNDKFKDKKDNEDQNLKYKFMYPQTDQKFKVIIDQNDLKKKFSDQKRSSINSSTFKMCKKLSSDRKVLQAIYTRCIQCTATINFKRSQQNVFVISKFANEHHHFPKKKKAYNRICELLKIIPQNLSSIQKYKLVSQQVKVNKPYFYCCLSKIKYLNHPNIQEQVNHLTDLSYGYYFQSPISIKELEIPNISLFYFYSAKQQDITDIGFFLQEYQLYPFQRIYLGLFYDVNLYEQIVPYGLVFFKEKQVSTICALIQYFRKFSGSLNLNVIVGYDQIVAEALDFLNSNSQSAKISYIYDQQSVRRHVGDNSTKDLSILELVQNISSEIQLDRVLAKIQRQIQPKSQLINSILRYPEKYSIAKFKSQKPSTIGLAYKLQTYSKARNIIKHKLKFQKKFDCKKYKFSMQCMLRILYNIVKLRHSQLNIIDIYYTRYQLFFEQPDLQPLRNFVSKKIFNIFLFQYAISFKNELMKYQQNEYYLEYKGTIHKVIKIDNKWMCNCGYFYKIGVPCCHQIRVVRQNGCQLDFINYINEKWIINEQIRRKEMQRPKKLAGRPKLSRRNISK